MTFRAETDQTCHQHIDLLERFLAGKLVQQLQHRPLRRRQHDRPVPVAEMAPGQAAVDPRLVRRPVDGHRRLEPFDAGRNRLGPKQLAGIVKDEGRDDGKFSEPPRCSFLPIEVNLQRSLARQVVREAVQFQRRVPAHRDWLLKHHLQRDHDVLPAQRRCLLFEPRLVQRAPKHPPRHRVQPTVRDVAAAQGARVAHASKPGGVRDQSFGQLPVHAV